MIRGLTWYTRENETLFPIPIFDATAHTIFLYQFFKTLKELEVGAEKKPEIWLSVDVRRAEFIMIEQIALLILSASKSLLIRTQF